MTAQGNLFELPLQLEDLIGEVWCLTLCRAPVDEVLLAMGAKAATLHDTTGEEPSGRLAGLDRDARSLPVMLLGREVGQGWTLVLESDSWTGWVGANEEVLAALPGLVGTIVRHSNGLRIIVADGGVVKLWLDPLMPWRRGGADPTRFDDVLAPLDLGDVAMRWSSAQQAVLVLDAVIGVRLRAYMFNDPWRGGEVR